MCDFSNADTFLRSALSSATTCYELGRLRQLLTSQEDTEGGEIICIFKKAGAYRDSAKVPRRKKMTHRKIWHHTHLTLDDIGFVSKKAHRFCFGSQRTC